MERRIIKVKKKVRKPPPSSIKEIVDLNRFNNKHKDSRGFIIGGGPSILDIQNSGFDFKILQNEITVGVNKAYILFTPTYLIWTDAYFFKTFKEEVFKLDCVKFCPANVAKKFSLKNDKICIIRRDKDAKGNTYVSSMSDPIPMWNNSGVTGLRIAYILGLNPIYLVGFDIHHTDEKDRTHFHTEYDNKRISKTTPKRYELFYDSFSKTIKDLKAINIKIYSCSKTSRLNNVIEYVDIATLF